ncbi:hypothetical protein ENUP19_0082G0149 [Entamoeba nuttalli]|uniref:TLDc domain-containing protein n=2 Tax=Entamoeba nuttalli TaxID=412467 RepID=K2H0Z9_ENTNP|nr:hypothetical protein ENU1_066420 [Entamoeba nuttalli P19]EKE41148.1 hypothetical protein ENU1_066420 [Entamoeba nuttalli P19]|eukprot:XP_008856517.1 hypothetical protein ENU1_066420 [Entamoeba nuttalli P19]
MELPSIVDNLKFMIIQFNEIKSSLISLHKQNVFENNISFDFLHLTKKINDENFYEIREEFDNAAINFDQYRNSIFIIEKHITDCFYVIEDIQKEIEIENNKLTEIGEKLDQYEEILNKKYKELNKPSELQIITNSSSQSINSHQKKITKTIKNQQKIIRSDGNQIINDKDKEDIELLNTNKKVLLQWCNGKSLSIRYDSKYDGESQKDFIKYIKGYGNIYLILFDQNMNVFGCFIHSPILITNKPVVDIFGFIFEIAKEGTIHLKKCNKRKDVISSITLFEDNCKQANSLLYIGKDQSTGMLILKPFIQNGMIKQIYKSYSTSNSLVFNSIQRFETRRIVLLEIDF